MDSNELEEILRLHKLWLADDKDGKQADLTEANLRNNYLGYANLADANLTGADLRGNLYGANLPRANLSYVDLTKAILCTANLADANLFYANLTKADLTKADLTGANLSNAYLCNADLRYVNLADANLTGANMTGADLTGADLTGANMTGADLRYADLTETIFKSNKFSDWKAIQTKNPSYGENTMNFTVTKKSPSKIIKGYYNDINLFLRVADTLGEFGVERDIEGNPTESSWIQYGKKLHNINVVFLPLNKQWAGYTVIYEDEIVTITL